jgi:hypothetical protein
MKKRNLHVRMISLLMYIFVLGSTIYTCRGTQLPVPTAETVMNGAWAKQVENYFGENIGFHDTLFRLKSRFDLLMGEKMIRNVYVSDEMLLEKLLPEETDAESAAAPVNAFYESSGIPTYFILVPSASEIYESRLPANAVQQEQESLIRQIYGATVSGVRCVDTCSILSSLSEEYIYYRTDTHWTSGGAYYVYQSAIQKMGFTAVPYNRYVISHLSTEFCGNLYRQTLYQSVKPDVLDCYIYENGGSITQIEAYYADGTSEDRGTSLYWEEALETQDMYRFYLGKPCQKLVIRTDLNNGKKLLLYKDDFADCMIPFLLQHYSEICVVNLEQTGADFGAIAAPDDYTQALFLCSMSEWQTLFGGISD